MFHRAHMPSLGGATEWLNSEPLAPAETYLGYGAQRAIGVLDQTGGSIAFRFHARDAHIVLSPGARGPSSFRVLLDGEAPGPSRGVDLDKDGNGLLRDGRLYQLVRPGDVVRERTLEITFREPGAEAYAFTLG